MDESGTKCNQFAVTPVLSDLRSAMLSFLLPRLFTILLAHSTHSSWHSTQVRAGDQIPVDGVVVRGAGSVDESCVTGESVPLHKDTGSAVLGGTVCQQGYIEVKAEAAGASTMLAQIVALLERAQGEKTLSQTTIERFVQWYTPAVSYPLATRTRARAHTHTRTHAHTHTLTD
jgi:high-affinity K+ transport system ATPase subunit B